jgi:hypothetical protein
MKCEKLHTCFYMEKQQKCFSVPNFLAGDWSKIWRRKKQTSTRSRQNPAQVHVVGKHPTNEIIAHAKCQFACFVILNNDTFWWSCAHVFEISQKPSLTLAATPRECYKGKRDNCMSSQQNVSVNGHHY